MIDTKLPITDALERDVNIGDIIVYTKGSYNDLSFGKVTGCTKCYIKFSVVKYAPKRNVLYLSEELIEKVNAGQALVYMTKAEQSQRKLEVVKSRIHS
ncbi:hypothetical protein [Yersinia phage vB_YenM_P778]